MRQSPFCSTKVSTCKAPYNYYDSFTYISIPRNGSEKLGYSSLDGAEFATESNMTMSWSCFEYSTDVYVDVTLTTNKNISSANQVKIRPSKLKFSKQLLSDSTIRIGVSYNPGGYRFSVEFDSELFTAYDRLGVLSETVDAHSRDVHIQPRNAMMIFAQPKVSDEDGELIPKSQAGTIFRQTQGDISYIDDVQADVISFGPGTYFMGPRHMAELSSNVKWIYFAPGAYVKGAFKFPEGPQSCYRVTGYGVLSGEQYIYTKPIPQIAICIVPRKPIIATAHA